MRRREALAGLGSALTLGAAGCLSSLPGQATEVDDGLVMDHRTEFSNETQAVFNIDLEEGEWSSKTYSIQGPYTISGILYTMKGSVCVGVMSHQEFDSSYRSGDNEPYGYYAVASGEDQVSIDGSAEGSTNWVIVADNTGYFDDHEPNGRVEGTLKLSAY